MGAGRIERLGEASGEVGQVGMKERWERHSGQ